MTRTTQHCKQASMKVLPIEGKRPAILRILSIPLAGCFRGGLRCVAGLVGGATRPVCHAYGIAITDTADATDDRDTFEACLIFRGPASEAAGHPTPGPCIPMLVYTRMLMQVFAWVALRDHQVSPPHLTCHVSRNCCLRRFARHMIRRFIW